MVKAPSNSAHPQTRAEWRKWLKQHHTRTEGVWLISYKKATGQPRFEYEEAIEEAMCFGWIDSKPNRLDDERSMLWFAPSKAGTGWSKINKARAEKMIAAGRMKPTGLAKIEAAQRDGSWNALDAIEALEIPADLAAALSANPIAQQHFAASLNGSLTPKSRRPARNVLEETARLAAENIRANQWRQ